MTQQELAARAGYKDRSTIAKIESGVVDLQQSKIKKLAEILGVTPGELLGWESARDGIVGLSLAIGKDANAFHLFTVYMSLPSEDRLALRLMADALAAKQKEE